MAILYLVYCQPNNLESCGAFPRCAVNLLVCRMVSQSYKYKESVNWYILCQCLYSVPQNYYVLKEGNIRFTCLVLDRVIQLYNQFKDNDARETVNNMSCLKKVQSTPLLCKVHCVHVNLYWHFSMHFCKFLDLGSWLSYVRACGCDWMRRRHIALVCSDAKIAAKLVPQQKSIKNNYYLHSPLLRASVRLQVIQ